MPSKRHLLRLCKSVASSQHQSQGPKREQDPLAAGVGRESVSEQIRRLRKEQRREQAPQPPSLQGQMVDPHFIAYGYLEDDLRFTPRSRTLAGPAPPPSWRHSIRKARYQRREVPKIGASLEALCADSIGKNIRLFLVGEQRELFEYIPSHIKETILHVASTLGTINNEELELFEDEGLAHLHLALGNVTCLGLQKLIPKLNAPTSSSWEDLAEEDGFRVRGCPNLVEINVSFCVRLEGLGFARMLQEHWRFLRVVRVAGCFGTSDGPPALRILTSGLPWLGLLDLSTCFWVTTRLLLQLSWEEEIRALEVLELEDCSNVSADIQGKIRELAKREDLRVVR